MSERAVPPPGYFTAGIETTDPEIAGLLEAEKTVHYLTTAFPIY